MKLNTSEYALCVIYIDVYISVSCTRVKDFIIESTDVFQTKYFEIVLKISILQLRNFNVVA